jgi:hypothetical protein
MYLMEKALKIGVIIFASIHINSGLKIELGWCRCSGGQR